MDYQLVQSSIEVKKGTGVEGFLRVIKQVLKLPRLQTVTIEAKGKISYDRYVLGEESREPVEVGYDDLEPYSLIRNGTVEGVEVLSSNPAVVLSLLLDRVVKDQLHPCAIVTGANTILPTWFSHGTGRTLLTVEYVCGLPVYLDRNIPDSTLIVGGAYTRDADLTAVQKFYSLEMAVASMPETTVEVLSWTDQ
jgi:hypothetical protein